MSSELSTKHGGGVGLPDFHQTLADLQGTRGGFSFQRSKLHEWFFIIKYFPVFKKDSLVVHNSYRMQLQLDKKKNCVFLDNIEKLELNFLFSLASL